jgi:hypothetical protein
MLTSCLNGKITVGHRFAIIANHYFPLSKALYVREGFVLRNVIYMILALFFTFLTYESLPRNGCQPSGICVDFEVFEPIGVLFFFLAILFSFLCLKRLFNKTNFTNLIECNGKDLTDTDK